MTKLTPCLWFDDRIDEAIQFYTTTFKDSMVIELVRNSPDSAAFTADEDQAIKRRGGLNDQTRLNKRQEEG